MAWMPCRNATRPSSVPRNVPSRTWHGWCRSDWPNTLQNSTKTGEPHADNACRINAVLCLRFLCPCVPVSLANLGLCFWASVACMASMLQCSHALVFVVVALCCPLLLAPQEASIVAWPNSAQLKTLFFPAKTEGTSWSTSMRSRLANRGCPSNPPPTCQLWHLAWISLVCSSSSVVVGSGS